MCVLHDAVPLEPKGDLNLVGDALTIGVDLAIRCEDVMKRRLIETMSRRQNLNR